MRKGSETNTFVNYCVKIVEEKQTEVTTDKVDAKLKPKIGNESEGMDTCYMYYVHNNNCYNNRSDC